MTLILENMKVTLNLEEDGDIDLDDGAGEYAWMVIWGAAVLVLVVGGTDRE